MGPSGLAAVVRGSRSSAGSASRSWSTVFLDQAHGLVEGGADVLILETCQDMLEMKAQILACARGDVELAGRGVPIQCSVTLDPTGRMLLGTDIRGALATLEAMDVDVIGLNCSTGPDLMRDAIRYLSQNASTPIHCIPNAGLPDQRRRPHAVPDEAGPDGRDAARVRASSSASTSSAAAAARRRSTSRALVAAIGRARRAAPRPGRSGWFLSSGMTATALRQEPRPLLIGERLNTQGSRKIKRLALDDRIEDMIPIAREQVEGGAHALDVCMALTERTDEAAQMRRLVKKLALSVEAPLVIDSTEAQRRSRRRSRPTRAAPLINSINLENGRERIDAVMPLVMRYGAAVIALTIDERGMAKTAARKLEVARRIHDIVTAGVRAAARAAGLRRPHVHAGHRRRGVPGLRRRDASRASGSSSASCPGVLTSLGVSNVSFGLGKEARAVLNSVFLYHCVQAGLDMAIVNPADIMPYAEIAERRPPAGRGPDLRPRRRRRCPHYINHFEGRTARRARSADEAAEAAMSVEQRIHYQILHRKPAGIEALIDEAVKRQDPVAVLNTVLLPAMKEVGDKFGAGELILPFVLQSAEVMKKAVAQLENYLEKNADVTQGPRRARHRVRRRARHRQEPGEDDPRRTTATPCSTSASRCRCRRSSTRRAR